MLVGESVARQQRMVVWRMTLVVRKMKRTKTEQRMKWWKRFSTNERRGLQDLQCCWFRDCGSEGKDGRQSWRKQRLTS